LAVQDAAGTHPERIDDAVQCLDTSGLEGEDEERVKLARSLARRLHTIIEKRGVTLDDIPEEGEGAEYLFYEPAESAVGEDAAPAPKMTLARETATGDWRFTALTLASIHALEEAVDAEVAAEPATPAERSVAAARRSPRATMGTFLDAMNADPRDFDQAIRCLNPVGRDPEVWAIRGTDLAVKLKTVMDKIAAVVSAEIPDSPDGPPYEWYTGDAGNIALGRIDAEVAESDKFFALVEGEWRFTPTTLDTLDDLYLAFEDKPIVRELKETGVEERLTFGQRLQRWMPGWLRTEFFHLQGWQWVALAALLPLGSLVHSLVVVIVATIMRRWLRRRKVDIDRESQRHVARSTGVFVTVLCWYYAIRVLDLPEGLLALLLPATKLAWSVMAVWVAYRFVDIVGGHIAANKEVRLTHFDDVLIPLLRTILRIFVVVVGLLLVAEWMNWEITTILAALGIGGIAVAFAAQDTIGNLFGSITVLFDRPFGIGDWIVVGDDVEGTVERVGFRSTRVRTFYNSIITIPNSKMVNTQVDNYGARTYRRAKVMLSVTYSTPPEKVDAFCEGIRELIRLHPYTRKDYYHVYFNKFADSSLDILLYVFFEVPDWATELRERHRLFVDILRLAQRLGVEFAYPTRMLYLSRVKGIPEAVEAPTIVLGRDDPDTVGVGEAAKLFEDAYGPQPTPPGPVAIDAAPRSKAKPPHGPRTEGKRD
jgi:MscS family membrane protein